MYFQIKHPFLFTKKEKETVAFSLSFYNLLIKSAAAFNYRLGISRHFLYNYPIRIIFNCPKTISL